MKKLMILLSVVAVIALAGCDARPVKIDADNISKKLTYFQDSKIGECFCVVGITKGKNIIGNAVGIGITRVPCTKKVLSQIED